MSGCPAPAGHLAKLRHSVDAPVCGRGDSGRQDSRFEPFPGPCQRRLGVRQGGRNLPHNLIGRAGCGEETDADHRHGQAHDGGD